MFSVEITGLGGIDKLQSKLKADIRSGMDKLRARSEDIIRESIMSNIYGSVGGSAYYSNTGSIANAFTINVNGLTIDAFMDEGKLSAYSPPAGRFGAYTGLSGQDFRQGILQSFETGGSSPIYAVPGTGYWNKAVERMQTELVDELRDHLASCGWSVS